LKGIKGRFGSEKLGELRGFKPGWVRKRAQEESFHKWRAPNVKGEVPGSPPVSKLPGGERGM